MILLPPTGGTLSDLHSVSLSLSLSLSLAIVSLAIVSPLSLLLHMSPYVYVFPSCFSLISVFRLMKNRELFENFRLINFHVLISSCLIHLLNLNLNGTTSILIYPTPLAGRPWNSIASLNVITSPTPNGATTFTSTFP